MRDFTIDLMALPDGMYNAVLLGCGDGACPQTFSVSGDVIFERLQWVFGFTQEKLDRIKERISSDTERTTEIPVKATIQLLQIFGFEPV
jgi:hypothetical protein